MRFWFDQVPRADGIFQIWKEGETGTIRCALVHSEETAQLIVQRLNERDQKVRSANENDEPTNSDKDNPIQP